MNSRTKVILYITVFILFLALAYNLYNNLAQDHQPQQQGQQGQQGLQLDDMDQKNQTSAVTAPDFIVYDHKGGEIKLSDFRGKPIVLNFWASWCPPCRQEMPHFNQAFIAIGEEVVFMMVDMVDGKRETLNKGQAFIAEQKYVLPVYFDIKGTAAQAYEVNLLPTTLFIDGDGNIIKLHQGIISQDALQAGISLINKDNS